MWSNSGGNSSISKVAAGRPISLSDEAAPAADMERSRRGRSISSLDEAAPAAETWRAGSGGVQSPCQMSRLLRQTWSTGSGVRGQRPEEESTGKGATERRDRGKGYHGPIAQLVDGGRTFPVHRLMGEADHKVILTLKFCYLDQIDGS